MRAVVVMTYPPELEGGAAARCAVGLLRGLSALGVECTAISAAKPNDAPDVPADLDVKVVRVEPTPRWRSRWDELAHPLAISSRSRFASALRMTAADADVVHFFDTAAASSIGLTDRPSLVQIHYLTLRDQRIGPLHRRPNRDALVRLRVERRAIRAARWLVTNSQEIAGPLEAMSHKAVTVAPLALDPTHYKASSQLSGPAAGLIGTAAWPPTANAVRRLLGRVWPQVVARVPNAELLLAGKGMERSAFLDLPDVQGVRWCGPVESSTEFLGQTSVLLYPLSSGSGTKVKVLEALASGVPVVTTPDGAEGLRCHDGLAVHLDDDEIVRSTVALLEDPSARHAAGELARANFMAHHSPAVAAEPVLRLYERMLQATRNAKQAQGRT